MKVQEFKVAIEELQYVQRDSGREGEAPLYYIIAKVLEKKRGAGKFKTYHNATIYVDDIIFNDKSIEKGDVLLFTDKVKWNSKPIKFTTYDPEKLKEKPAAKIKHDKNGKPYVMEYAYTYTLSAPMGSWFLDMKQAESLYWQVGKLKLYMDSEEELFNDSYYEFYIDDNEYEKLSKIEDNKTTAHAYVRKQAKGKCDMQITLTREESLNKWRCKIEKTSEVY